MSRETAREVTPPHYDADNIYDVEVDGPTVVFKYRETRILNRAQFDGELSELKYKYQPKIDSSWGPKMHITVYDTPEDQVGTSLTNTAAQQLNFIGIRADTGLSGLIEVTSVLTKHTENEERLEYMYDQVTLYDVARNDAALKTADAGAVNKTNVPAKQAELDEAVAHRKGELPQHMLSKRWTQQPNERMMQPVPNTTCLVAAAPTSVMAGFLLPNAVLAIVCAIMGAAIGIPLAVDALPSCCSDDAALTFYDDEKSSGWGAALSIPKGTDDQIVRIWRVKTFKTNSQDVTLKTVPSKYSGEWCNGETYIEFKKSSEDGIWQSARNEKVIFSPKGELEYVNGTLYRQRLCNSCFCSDFADRTVLCCCQLSQKEHAAVGSAGIPKEPTKPPTEAIMESATPLPWHTNAAYKKKTIATPAISPEYPWSALQPSRDKSVRLERIRWHQCLWDYHHARSELLLQTVNSFLCCRSHVAVISDGTLYPLVDFHTHPKRLGKVDLGTFEDTVRKYPFSFFNGKWTGAGVWDIPRLHLLKSNDEPLFKTANVKDNTVRVTYVKEGNLCTFDNKSFRPSWIGQYKPNRDCELEVFKVYDGKVSLSREPGHDFLIHNPKMMTLQTKQTNHTENVDNNRTFEWDPLCFGFSVKSIVENTCENTCDTIWCCWGNPRMQSTVGSVLQYNTTTQVQNPPQTALSSYQMGTKCIEQNTGEDVLLYAMEQRGGAELVHTKKMSGEEGQPVKEQYLMNAHQMVRNTTHNGFDPCVPSIGYACGACICFNDFMNNTCTWQRDACRDVTWLPLRPPSSNRGQIEHMPPYWNYPTCFTNGAILPYGRRHNAYEHDTQCKDVSLCASLTLTSALLCSPLARAALHSSGMWTTAGVREPSSPSAVTYSPSKLSTLACMTAYAPWLCVVCRMLATTEQMCCLSEEDLHYDRNSFCTQCMWSKGVDSRVLICVMSPLFRALLITVQMVGTWMLMSNDTKRFLGTHQCTSFYIFRDKCSGSVFKTYATLWVTRLGICLGFVPLLLPVALTCFGGQLQTRGMVKGVGVMFFVALIALSWNLTSQDEKGSVYPVSNRDENMACSDDSAHAFLDELWAMHGQPLSECISKPIPQGLDPDKVASLLLALQNPDERFGHLGYFGNYPSPHGRFTPQETWDPTQAMQRARAEVYSFCAFSRHNVGDRLMISGRTASPAAFGNRASIVGNEYAHGLPESTFRQTTTSGETIQAFAKAFSKAHKLLEMLSSLPGEVVVTIDRRHQKRLQVVNQKLSWTGSGAIQVRHEIALQETTFEVELPTISSVREYIGGDVVCTVRRFANAAEVMRHYHVKFLKVDDKQLTMRDDTRYLNRGSKIEIRETVPNQVIMGVVCGAGVSALALSVLCMKSIGMPGAMLLLVAIVVGAACWLQRLEVWVTQPNVEELCFPNPDADEHGEMANMSQGRWREWLDRRSSFEGKHLSLLDDILRPAGGVVGVLQSARKTIEGRHGLDGRTDLFAASLGRFRDSTPECVPRQLDMGRVQRAFIGTIVAVAFAWQVVQLCLIMPSLNGVVESKMSFNTNQRFKRIVYAQHTPGTFASARKQGKIVIQTLTTGFERFLRFFSNGWTNERRAIETDAKASFLKSTKSAEVETSICGILEMTMCRMRDSGVELLCQPIIQMLVGDPLTSYGQTVGIAVTVMHVMLLASYMVSYMYALPTQPLQGDSKLIKQLPPHFVDNVPEGLPGEQWDTTMVLSSCALLAMVCTPLRFGLCCLGSRSYELTVGDVIELRTCVSGGQSLVRFNNRSHTVAWITTPPDEEFEPFDVKHVKPKAEGESAGIDVTISSQSGTDYKFTMRLPCWNSCTFKSDSACNEDSVPALACLLVNSVVYPLYVFDVGDLDNEWVHALFK